MRVRRGNRVEQLEARRVEELARRISRDYRGRELLLVGILKGSFVFLADLMRRLEVPSRVDFVRLASYGSSQLPGQVRLLKDLELEVRGQDVLVVEDIVDTGHTLAFLLEELRRRGAGSVRVCVLVDKRARRQVPLHPDYVGFSLEEDAFLVGYGLDFDERYRWLNGIYALEPPSR